MIFYFSGTGNSAWAARTLAHGLNEPLISMAKALKTGEMSFKFERGETIGFVFPTYGWDLPPIVRTFIENVELCSKQLHSQDGTKQIKEAQYTYFVTTCGDDTGRLLRRTRQTLSKRGLHLDSAWTILMPDSYVFLPGFDVDRPTLKKAKLADAPIRLQTILRQISERRRGIFDVLPGHFAYTKTYILGGLFRRYMMKDKPFHATDQCTQCKICERVCPTSNITVGNEGPQWHNRCTMCLACYHHCPHRAIAYGRQTKNKGQYLHPEAPRTEKA